MLGFDKGLIFVGLIQEKMEGLGISGQIQTNIPKQLIVIKMLVLSCKLGKLEARVLVCPTMIFTKVNFKVHFCLSISSCTWK